MRLLIGLIRPIFHPFNGYSGFGKWGFIQIFLG